MLTLVLTRHGHTDRSEPEQYLGQRIDIPLSARGRADAERLRERLVGVEFARVIASPLLRTRQTAAIVAPTFQVETDDRLKEADYGAWEGMPAQLLDASQPELRAAWKEDPATRGAPGGENGDAIAERASAFLRDLCAWEVGQPPRGDATGGATGRTGGVTGRRVLVVGHSTLNRVLLAVALGVPVRDYRRRLRQDWLNLTVLRMDRDGRGMLILANDVAHLRPPGAPPWSD